jgi:hypothetical protein
MCSLHSHNVHLFSEEKKTDDMQHNYLYKHQWLYLDLLHNHFQTRTIFKKKMHDEAHILYSTNSISRECSEHI